MYKPRLFYHSSHFLDPTQKLWNAEQSSPSAYYTLWRKGKAMYFGPKQSILRIKPYGGLMGMDLPDIQESVWRYNI